MGAVIPRHDDRLEKSTDLLVESKTYIQTVIIVTVWVSCFVFPTTLTTKKYLTGLLWFRKKCMKGKKQHRRRMTCHSAHQKQWKDPCRWVLPSSQRGGLRSWNYLSRRRLKSTEICHKVFGEVPSKVWPTCWTHSRHQFKEPGKPENIFSHTNIQIERIVPRSGVCKVGLQAPQQIMWVPFWTVCQKLQKLIISVDCNNAMIQQDMQEGREFLGSILSRILSLGKERMCSCGDCPTEDDPKCEGQPQSMLCICIIWESITFKVPRYTGAQTHS